jgi:glutamate-ammonia-ligase adenylyltransferase
VESTLDYYRSMGRTWERQALIKARPVAGDLALGHGLVRRLEAFVYERALRSRDIREIQELKTQIEDRVRARGGESDEVKEGRGGIRDIEFTVQFLQLLNGHDAARVRCHGTLTALRRLEEVGALKAGERRRLEQTYRFLRTVEHRLQTMHETPARKLPTDEVELRRLALRIRPRVPTAGDPAREFRALYLRLTESTNAILERLVHAPFRDREARAAAVVDAVLDAADEEDARDAVAAFGFRDPARAVRTLRSLAREENSYFPRIRQFFASVAPALLRAVEGTVEPDETLLAFERLVGALQAKSALYQMLDDNPDVLAVLVDLCGGSPYLTNLVIGNPAMFDPVLESLVVSRRAGMLPLDDLPTAESLPTGPELPRALHALRDLEMIRTGIRDLQGRANVRNVMEELTRLAEEILRLALSALSRTLFERKGEPRRADGSPGRFAVLGLGRLGAGEMIYGSDLDLVFLHDADGETTRGRNSAVVLTDLAQQLGRTLGQVSEHGRLYRVDTRLRPEGSGGPLVPSLAAFAGHVTTRLETWERLALLRARPVAGDPELGAEAIRVIHAALFDGAPRPELAAEVRDLRWRLEETAKGLDLKRGPGGLVDIEFACGLLQLTHGPERPEVRVPNLTDAFDALRAAAVLDSGRHEKWRSAYQILRKVESRLRIAYNSPLDRVPDAAEERDLLARRLGYRGGLHAPGRVLTDELSYFTRLTRELFEEVLAEREDDR